MTRSRSTSGLCALSSLWYARLASSADAASVRPSWASASSKVIRARIPRGSERPKGDRLTVSVLRGFAGRPVAGRSDRRPRGVGVAAVVRDGRRGARSDEPVADVANGLDHGRGGAQLLAQALDVRIDGARVGVRANPPDVAQK